MFPSGIDLSGLISLSKVAITPSAKMKDQKNL
jgi:hypothetical protein